MYNYLAPSIMRYFFHLEIKKTTPFRHSISSGPIWRRRDANFLENCQRNADIAVSPFYLKVQSVCSLVKPWGGTFDFIFPSHIIPSRWISEVIKCSWNNQLCLQSITHKNNHSSEKEMVSWRWEVVHHRLGSQQTAFVKFVREAENT